jgi:hypothetical protein
MNRAYQHYSIAGSGKSAGIGAAAKKRPTTRNQAEFKDSGVSGPPGRPSALRERRSSAWFGLVITVVPWLILFGALVVARYLIGEASGR